VAYSRYSDFVSQGCRMKIGFNCSSFDLLHAGHVTMLKMEKQLCDYLVVALQIDPTIDRPGVKNKPVQSAYERYVQLQACKYVDEILIYETEFDLLQLLKTQTIHIRFLSDEYLNRDFTGKQWCIDNGIELHYHKREHVYSSSELRDRTVKLENKKETESGNVLPQYSPNLIKGNK
jgi:glycerol-3-phosphate cytidylyltransferase